MVCGMKFIFQSIITTKKNHCLGPPSSSYIGWHVEWEGNSHDSFARLITLAQASIYPFGPFLLWFTETYVQTLVATSVNHPHNIPGK
jgi:hypothetical protein